MGAVECGFVRSLQVFSIDVRASFVAKRDLYA